MEATLHSSRLEMARRYAAANGLNRIVARSGGDRIGIIATGKTWFDLRQAMRDLGLEGEALQRAGVRLLKVGMPYPLEPGMVISIETTLQHPRRGFIKLEDTVAVTETGFEIFGEGARGWNRGGTSA